MTTNKKATPAEVAKSDANSNGCDYIPTDKITVLTCYSKFNLTKTYFADRTRQEASKAASFKIKIVEVTGWDDFRSLFGDLHSMPKCCPIRGKFVGKDKAEKGDKPGTFLRNNANFYDQPLHWFMVDVDNFEPAFAMPTDPAAVEEYIETVLAPSYPEFLKASYYWHLSSSAGITYEQVLNDGSRAVIEPSNKLKCHIHFLSKTPYLSSEMAAWAKTVGKQVDASVFRPAQYNYTADPIFEEGIADPVAVRCGFHQGAEDYVDLVISENILELAHEAGAGEGGSDMKLVDPSKKEGILGLFHRTYSAEEVLLTLLDEFEQVSDRRYTWLNGGGTPEGVWVHDKGMHVGSSHNTWPINGLANLWDLVRVFKFGHLDQAEDDFEQLDIDSRGVGHLPSDVAMREWAGKLPEIIELRAIEDEERQADLAILVAKISSATTNELNGELKETVRDMKAESVDPGIAATLDKAMQQRLKALSPNNAAPPIADVRRMTLPKAPGVTSGRRVLDKSDQYATACELMKSEFRDDNKQRLLLRVNSAWYRFNERCFVEVGDEAIRNVAWPFLSTSMCRNEETGQLLPFKPGKGDVSGIVDALCAVLAVDVPSPPTWLPGYEAADPMNLIVMQNGILNLASGQLLSHTPRLFTTNCLPFDFDPEAQCLNWQRFLDQIWPGDQESQHLLQEWFGYCLTADTRQQKFLMIVGPKRSGKGTIARLLGDMLGHSNVIGPTLSSIGEGRDLEQWIDKLAAIVGDARGGGKDPQTIVERILSITGEDKLSVRRIYGKHWNGKLSARITILSNELLRLGDASGALVGRMMVLKTNRSFYGEEDILLSDKLALELPGILNWALSGKRRLTERGRFVQPASARDLLQATQEANDQVGTFVDECCELGGSYSEQLDDLFYAWRRYCENENSHAGQKNIFSKNLAASKPDLVPHRPRIDGKQKKAYQGIRLNATTRDSLGLSDFERD